MASIEYKLFFNDVAATRDQLDRVEEIVVEQEVDMAWEARLQIPICTDDKGNWSGTDDGFLQAFGRVRVEIKVAGGPFTPLIDGPIVGSESAMSSQPGQSQITIRVQDDSVYLNRKDTTIIFENKLDHEVASQVFGQSDQIASTDIETTPAPSGNSAPTVVQRGTEMRVLRSLARRQGMHAYVLPGDEPSQSVGCFKKFPTQPDGLPSLVLLGPGRNVDTFHLSDNSQSPASVEAYTINLDDISSVKSKTGVTDLDLLGDAPQVPESHAATVIAPASSGGGVDLDQFTKAEAERLSYSLEATGTLVGDCFPAALAPYRIVVAIGINAKQSGNYLIHKVTHTLSRSVYQQAFTLKRNAASAGGGAGGPASPIF